MKLENHHTEVFFPHSYSDKSSLSGANMIQNGLFRLLADKLPLCFKARASLHHAKDRRPLNKWHLIQQGEINPAGDPTCGRVSPSHTKCTLMCLFFLLNLAAIFSLIASFIEQYLTHTNKKLADVRGGSGALFSISEPLLKKWAGYRVHLNMTNWEHDLVAGFLCSDNVQYVPSSSFPLVQYSNQLRIWFEILHNQYQTIGNVCLQLLQTHLF